MTLVFPEADCSSTTQYSRILTPDLLEEFGITLQSFSMGCTPLYAAATVYLNASVLLSVTEAKIQSELAGRLEGFGDTVIVKLRLAGEVSEEVEESTVETCTMENAASSLEVNLEGVEVCTATQCAVGFVKNDRSAASSNMTWYDCVEMTEDVTTCLSNGDCSTSAERPKCEEQVCVAETFTAKSTYETPVTTEKLCSSDADCRLSGDTTATCTDNQCVCGNGFENAGLFTSVCVTTDATTVRLSWVLEFPLGNCRTFDASQKATLMSIMTEVFVSPVTSFSVACGSIIIMGVSEVSREVANSHIAGAEDQSNPINVRIANSGNDGLKAQGNSGLMVFYNGIACTSELAVSSVMDSQGRCHGVVCTDGTAPRDVSGTYSCTKAAVLPALKSPSDKSSIGNGSKMLIILACVIGVVLLGAAGACCVSSGSGGYSSRDEREREERDHKEMEEAGDNEV